MKLPLSDVKTRDPLIEEVDEDDPRLKYHDSETFRNIPALVKATSHPDITPDVNVKLGPGRPSRLASKKLKYPVPESNKDFGGK